MSATQDAKYESALTPFFNGDKSWIKDELLAEGFPLFMIYAFCMTARETKTIISSRLPGGVGNDLIQDGYDLKGFQVKAKSCDWGPMGGFICQLPFFNKSGYNKIKFNAEQIAGYLYKVDSFKYYKTALLNIGQAKDSITIVLNNKYVQNDTFQALSALFDLHKEKGILSEQDKSDLKLLLVYTGKEDFLSNLSKDIYRIYAKKTGAIVTEYRKAETTSGHWSGENSLPDAANPFIHLERSFNKDGMQISVDALVQELRLKNMQDVYISTDQKTITGTAYNKQSIEDATVRVKCCLQLSNGLWKLYHGDIELNSNGGKFKRYDFLSDKSFPDLWAALGKVAEENAAQAKKDKAKDLQAQKSAVEKIEKLKTERVYCERNIFVIGESTKSVKFAGNDYYPVMGIMNPHPPYKEEQLSYKNAVSGDYDLFAFWPHISIAEDELIRMSELQLNMDLKAFIMGDKHPFTMEFIPGFVQLGPGAEEVSKESMEVGNISGLGNMVSGSLNSFASAFFRNQQFTNAAKANPGSAPEEQKEIALNKAFHSDEGGRPGVMEIEFPIAVFFPEKIKTKALYNRHSLTAQNEVQEFEYIKNRPEIDTYGGLIKNPEELVQLMIDCNPTASGKRYQIILHSEWMIHLLYISMTSKQQDDFDNRKGEFKVFFDSLISSKIDADLIDEKMKEFASIDRNHAKLYLQNGNQAFDQPAFLRQLQTVLLNRDDQWFEAIRNHFLKLAFLTSESAVKRRMDTERVLYTNPATA